jgi:hypothetical protein
LPEAAEPPIVGMKYGRWCLIAALRSRSRWAGARPEIESGTSSWDTDPPTREVRIPDSLATCSRTSCDSRTRRGSDAPETPKPPLGRSNWSMSGFAGVIPAILLVEENP